MFLLSKIIAANKMEMHHDFVRANTMKSIKMFAGQKSNYGIMGHENKINSIKAHS